MLNCFRKNNASIVAQLFKAGMEADTIVPGPKTKHKHGKFSIKHLKIAENHLIFDLNNVLSS